MKTKIILLFLAIIYSFIFTIPNVIVKNHSSTSSVSSFDYKVIDDALYGAYYKDMQERNFKLTDPINYERNNEKLPWASVPFLIIGGLAYWLDSLDKSLIIVVTLFSFLNFFIQYLLFFQLTRNAIISVLTVFLVPLSHIFLTSPSKMLYFLFSYPLFDRFLWTSIPRRQIEIFFLFLPLLLFYLAYINQSKILAVLTGVFLGLSADTYIYYYTFQMAGIFLLILYSLYRKNMKDVKILLITIITGLICSIPYILKTQFFKINIKHGMQFLSRLGLVQSQAINTVYISLFFILFFILFFTYFKLKRKTSKNFYFLSAFFIGNILIYNQHLITGLQLQTWHWLTITGRPWMLIMILYMLNAFIENTDKKTLMNVFFGTIIFLAIGWSLWANVGVAQNLAKYYEVDYEYYLAFDWLEKNTPKNSVVLSPSFIVSANIPLRTHNNVYLVNGFDSASPDCELIYRGLVALKMFNASPKLITGVPRKELTSTESLSTYLFHMRYYPETPENIKNSLLKLYSIINVDLNDVMQYKLDYIIIGPKEREIGKLSVDLPKRKVYSTDKLDIYEILFAKTNKSDLHKVICKSYLTLS